MNNSVVEQFWVFVSIYVPGIHVSHRQSNHLSFSSIVKTYCNTKLRCRNELNNSYIYPLIGANVDVILVQKVQKFSVCHVFLNTVTLYKVVSSQHTVHICELFLITVKLFSLHVVVSQSCLVSVVHWYSQFTVQSK